MEFGVWWVYLIWDTSDQIQGLVDAKNMLHHWWTPRTKLNKIFQERRHLWMSRSHEEGRKERRKRRNERGRQLIDLRVFTPVQTPIFPAGPCSVHICPPPLPSTGSHWVSMPVKLYCSWLPRYGNHSVARNIRNALSPAPHPPCQYRFRQCELFCLGPWVWALGP